MLFFWIFCISFFSFYEWIFFFNFWHWRIRFNFFDFLFFDMFCVICWSLSRFFCIFRRNLTWNIRKFELITSMFRCCFKWRLLIILLVRLFFYYFLIDSLTCNSIRKSCFFFNFSKFVFLNYFFSNISCFIVFKLNIVFIEWWFKKYWSNFVRQLM